MKHSIIQKKLLPLVLAFTAIVAVSSCAKRAEAEDKPVIAVSIVPQAWFVSRIAGDLVNVVILVDSGADPHAWEPSPRQMQLFNGADAWILSGTDFEIALEPKVRKQNPALNIVNGTEGVVFRTLEGHDHRDEEGDAHDDDEDHDASSAEIDRHTWLGRAPAKILASKVAKTLAELDPEHGETYRANLGEALAEIDGTFDRLAVNLAPLKGSTVFVYHPSFGYFLDEFGIEQEAVETGGKEPTAKHLAALIAEAREDRPAAVFVQAQFPAEAAKTLADSVGARVISLDPLAPDWLENIERIGSLMGESLK